MLLPLIHLSALGLLTGTEAPRPPRPAVFGQSLVSRCRPVSAGAAAQSQSINESSVLNISCLFPFYGQTYDQVYVSRSSCC